MMSPPPPLKNISTWINLLSPSSPTDPTNVLRLLILSDTSMSEFHKDIATLVHNFDMESLMENFNSVSFEQCLKQISLHFTHLGSGNGNIFPGDQDTGDTFKGLFIAVNFLKSLLYEHRSGWIDDGTFTLFATLLKFIQEYNVSGGFNANLPTVVFFNTQDTVTRVNPCYQDQIFNLLIQKPV